jgi:hypothetical protein
MSVWQAGLLQQLRADGRRVSLACSGTMNAVRNLGQLRPIVAMEGHTAGSDETKSYDEKANPISRRQTPPPPGTWLIHQ